MWTQFGKNQLIIKSNVSTIWKNSSDYQNKYNVSTIWQKSADYQNKCKHNLEKINQLTADYLNKCEHNLAKLSYYKIIFTPIILGFWCFQRAKPKASSWSRRLVIMRDKESYKKILESWILTTYTSTRLLLRQIIVQCSKP